MPECGAASLCDMPEQLDAMLEKRHAIGMDINGMTPDQHSRQVCGSILGVVGRHLS